MKERQDLITGIWKFNDSAERAELEKVALEWAKDESYIQLYIRKVSKDQTGIGFSYESDGSKESYDKFYERVSDQLKRRFGNDLAGWDIASNTFTIKGF